MRCDRRELSTARPARAGGRTMIQHGGRGGQQPEGGRGHFRRKPRTGRRILVRYLVLDGEDGVVESAVTHNIGVGGAFIATDDPAAPGSRLAIDLIVPDGPTIELRG